MGLVERLRTRVGRARGGAREHPEVSRGLVTGLAAADRLRDGGMAGDRERGSTDARGADPEAARIDVARGMAARAVAIECADRDVIAGRGDEPGFGEGRLG